MFIIRREEIPAISEVVVDGKSHNLGIHKDFRRHPLLKEFLPETGRISFSWVRLADGESLAAHAHPTTSVIIVSHGKGFCFGDLETNFSDGDVIIVPPGARHGFTGKGPQGYWALSIQLEGNGSYENVESARVEFASSKKCSPALEALIKMNEKHMGEYLSNPIFKFIEGSDVSDSAKRSTLLDAIQVWSNFYQKMVRLRSVVSSNPKYSDASETHLAEEFQHNLHLANDRGSQSKNIWDPALEAGSSWFVWKMFTLNDDERAALVHLVLEGSSTIFHDKAHKLWRPSMKPIISVCTMRLIKAIWNKVMRFLKTSLKNNTPVLRLLFEKVGIC